MNFETIANTAGGAILGMALGDYNDQRQYAQQAKLQQLQIQGAKNLGDYNYRKQLEMWNATNLEAQMAHAKAAGLNPALLYAKGGATGQLGATGGMPQGATAPQGGREVMDVTNQMMQLQLLKAQKENIEADTAQKQANVPNIEADTQNKILASVIADYTGREAKEVYERVTNPNRPSQAEAYKMSLDQQTAIARNIWELYEEGKLKEQSIAQIEGILQQNAKTITERKNIEKTMELIEQNIKGAKLENVIKELESKMQTETGIDRNSPTWLKILGRLFIGLSGQ